MGQELQGRAAEDRGKHFTETEPMGGDHALNGTLAHTILRWERFLCVKKQGHTYRAAWTTENTSCLLTLAVTSFST